MSQASERPLKPRPGFGRQSLARLVRDPLFAFLLIGVAIFLVDAWLGADDGRTVVVTEAQVERLATVWQQRVGAPPTSSELAALVDADVREEIMVREAKRLRLDEDDVVVRRRLAQKLSFLRDESIELEPAGESELRDYFERNRQRYRTPAVVSFSHIYFSPDRRDDPGAEAREALATLDPEAWRKAGDPFLLGRTYTHAGVDRIRRDFGDEFSAALAGLATTGAWQGPVASEHGAHLVRVDAKAEAKGRDYESVSARVALDYDAERLAEADAARWEALMSEYTVVLPGDE